MSPIAVRTSEEGKPPDDHLKVTGKFLYASYQLAVLNVGPTARQLGR